MRRSLQQSEHSPQLRPGTSGTELPASLDIGTIASRVQTRPTYSLFDWGPRWEVERPGARPANEPANIKAGATAPALSRSWRSLVVIRTFVVIIISVVIIVVIDFMLIDCDASVVATANSGANGRNVATGPDRCDRCNLWDENE